VITNAAIRKIAIIPAVKLPIVPLAVATGLNTLTMRAIANDMASRDMTSRAIKYHSTPGVFQGTVGFAGGSGDGLLIFVLSCPRFLWTPICPTGGRYGEIQDEQDQSKRCG
jgi:hypothetical protein